MTKASKVYFGLRAARRGTCSTAAGAPIVRRGKVEGELEILMARGGDGIDRIGHLGGSGRISTTTSASATPTSARAARTASRWRSSIRSLVHRFGTASTSAVGALGRARPRRTSTSRRRRTPGSRSTADAALHTARASPTGHRSWGPAGTHNDVHTLWKTSESARPRCGLLWLVPCDPGRLPPPAVVQRVPGRSGNPTFALGLATVASAFPGGSRGAVCPLFIQVSVRFPQFICGESTRRCGRGRPTRIARTLAGLYRSPRRARCASVRRGRRAVEPG